MHVTPYEEAKWPHRNPRLEVGTEIGSSAASTQQVAPMVVPHYVQVETLEVEPNNLSYEEEPVQILVGEVKELRNKRIHLMKVL